MSNLFKAREKLRVQGAIGFASHWLKNWRDIFKPITKRSSCNRAINLDSHLKTVLVLCYFSSAVCKIWVKNPLTGTARTA